MASITSHHSDEATQHKAPAIADKRLFGYTVLFIYGGYVHFGATGSGNRNALIRGYSAFERSFYISGEIRIAAIGG
jgi:hypothetical protein